MRPFLECPATLERRLTVRDGRPAFTLIELLMVIAVIAILAGFTFGLMRGATGRAHRSQATAELAVLATALESYKRHYGDYPRTASPADMLQALIGKRGPRGGAINGRGFLETGRFKTDLDPFESADAVLIDPWDAPFFYRYAAGDTTYLLLSAGPDGEIADDPTSLGASANLDNLHANR